MNAVMLILTLLLYVMLTIIIEVPVAYLLGFRKKDELLIVALASVVTNPLLNLIIIVYQSFFGEVTIVGVIGLELIVVLVEFGILYYVFKRDYTKQKLFIVAFVINTSSYVIGMLLGLLIY